MKATDIKKVLIIGSGTMGKHIGLQHALFGCDVTMYGELGMKTGKGFYNYPNPEYANQDFLERVMPVYKK